MKIVLGILLLYFSFETGSSDTGTEVSQTYEFILPCLKSDPKIDECMIRRINHMRPYLIKGIKEINFPSLEPIKFDKLELENDQGSFKIKALFENVIVRGASKYLIKSVKTDFNNSTTELKIVLPKIEIEAKYNATGTIMFIPAVSRGEIRVLLSDILVVAKMYGSEVTNEKGVEFMEVNNIIIDFRLKGIQFEVKDQSNQGKRIGETLNKILNDNSEKIINEIKPSASLKLADYLKTILNAIFRLVPLKVWLPDA